MDNMDMDHLLPDFSFVCTECGPTQFHLSPESVFYCQRRVHVFCEFCFNNVINLTGCDRCKVDYKYIRDLNGLDLNACPNKSRGCTYFKRKGQDQAFQMHCDGCRLRILGCPVDQVKMARCGWCGGLQELEAHIRVAHPPHFGKVACDKEITLPLNIYRNESAFHFFRHNCDLFYYKHKMDLVANRFYVYVQMLETEDEANRYFYQIKIMKDDRTLNIMEMCHSDSVEDRDITECEKCIMIPMKTLVKYVEDGMIRFTLSISNSARNSLFLMMC